MSKLSSSILWEFDQNSSKFWILPSWFYFDRFWLKFAKIVRSMNIHSVWRNLSNLSFSLLHAFLDISELTCQDLCLKIGLLLNRQGTMLWMQPLERVLCTNCLGKDHVIIKEKLAKLMSYWQLRPLPWHLHCELIPLSVIFGWKINIHFTSLPCFRLFLSSLEL